MPSVRSERDGGEVDWEREIEGGRNQLNGTKCFDDWGGFAR
jgi:hypothetical protein